MPINFKPIFTISPSITQNLIKIEAARQEVAMLPSNPTVLASLRKTAKLYTTHYSTMIEGNQLKPGEIHQILEYDGHFPGRERDENEVKGYYAALAQLEQYAAKGITITENIIQKLHALVMNNGRTDIKPTCYRDGQNVIRDGKTGTIVYLPPEAKDVSSLMRDLISWIKKKY